MLAGDIKRAVKGDTEVILFNIDSKADHRTGRDLILRVFLRVLNELQGYSGDHPHIAHMERHLASRGLLPKFHEAYRRHTGLEWTRERDAYQFNRDEVAKALAETLGQSQAAAEKWIDGAEDHFALTVENIADVGRLARPQHGFPHEERAEVVGHQHEAEHQMGGDPRFPNLR